MGSELATALGEGSERGGAGDDRLHVVVVPRLPGFRRLLDFDEQHVVHHAAVGLDVAVGCEEVIDRPLPHLPPCKADFHNACL